MHEDELENCLIDDHDLELPSRVLARFAEAFQAGERGLAQAREEYARFAAENPEAAAALRAEREAEIADGNALLQRIEAQDRAARTARARDVRREHRRPAAPDWLAARRGERRDDRVYVAPAPMYPVARVLFPIVRGDALANRMDALRLDDIEDNSPRAPRRG